MRVNPMMYWRKGWSRGTFSIALLVLPLLLIEFSAILGHHPAFYGHDEAEHLSAMFALERGERPYLDFFENHPLLPHLLLSALRRILGVDGVGQIRQLGLAVILLHVTGCFLLLQCFYSRFAAVARFSLAPVAMLWTALGLLTLWQDRLSYVWQLRPDWVCYFWALLGVFLHVRLHELWLRNGRWSSAVFAGGALASGFALALMSKAVFFFIPYVMTLAILALADFSALAVMVRGRWCALLAVNLSFVVLSLGAFAGCVAVELHLTGASTKAYYLANFTLNAERHPVQSFYDAKLFDVIAFASPGHLAAVLLGIPLISSTLLRLARAHEDRLSGLYILLGVVLVIGVNGLLPAFSNGGQWAQYYIPALLMLLFLTAATLGEGWRCIGKLTAGWKSGALLKRGVGLGFSLVFLGSLYSHYDAAINRLENVSFSRQLMQLRTRTDAGGALPDIILPADLSYLSFDPIFRPAHGRLWGYYFMLAADRGMWNDTYRLGLGPNPATHWRTLWRESPPDVVLVQSAADLENRIRQVAITQGVDLSWLREALRQDYVCQQRAGLAVSVRRDLSGRFVGWRQCDFYGVPVMMTGMGTADSRSLRVAPQER
jgi:hypothetical protein